MRSVSIVGRNPESFVGCRVGLELKNYQEDLEEILDTHKIDDKANFILTPIASPRALYYGGSRQDKDIDLIPDLVLDSLTWNLKVAVTIGRPPFQLFDKIFKHALYLPCPVVVIDCPENQLAQQALADVINRTLPERDYSKLILFRCRVSKKDSLSAKRIHLSQGASPSNTAPSSDKAQAEDEANEDSGLISCQSSSDEQTPYQKQTRDAWSTWNAFRSLLIPDDQIGVCLEFVDLVNTETEEFKRWNGERVSLVILNTDLFTSTKGFKNMRPVCNLREFIRTIALANSLKTGLVVQAREEKSDMQEYLNCLSNFCDILARDHQDDFRAWNDSLLSPLQPLSNNLDSSTYQVFENDKAKYTQYYLAMVEALNHLLGRQSSISRKIFVVMVLGAGRGPLVDAMIKAITGLDISGVTFKIYALDKNHSSIRSLLYKKVNIWKNHSPTIQTEVVKADMRVWQPEEKADIIATELLGSFSDNELSPECIDGTWRFATPETISIPQSYSSYVTPIMSYRIEQEVHKSRAFTQKQNIRDTLLVARLSNYYQISDTQELFTFTHEDISKEPIEGANQREKNLSFKSKVDAVCHGFAGYFTANLFGSVNISTLPSRKTPNMESWFSAFIPIESPVELSAGTCLEVKFSRKESVEQVWYEWQILKPIESKVHSLNGNGTAMSKLI